ncbi:hypothetical protein FOA52_008054 [Chlamydomonas sp. UWO 241]|nr:hypothetical protein FOA52_008054 [Chlamydomonas sp. UWO 241]
MQAEKFFDALGTTEKFFDALGTVSFLTLTAGSLAAGPITARKVLMSVMVGVWAVRLGSYLVARIHRAGKDVRSGGASGSPTASGVAWGAPLIASGAALGVIPTASGVTPTASGDGAVAVWVFATLSPVLIVNLMPATAPLCALDALGVAIFSLGFGFEVVSDWQKDAFRSDPANKGRFITEGLWSTSRHPNYFGESLLWWGVFACAAASFTAPVQWASAVGPAFVFLLVRQVWTSVGEWQN